MTQIILQKKWKVVNDVGCNHTVYYTFPVSSKSAGLSIEAVDFFFFFWGGGELL